MGRTTVEIEDRLLKEALKVTGAKSKRQLLESGLRELIRKAQREELRAELGTFKLRLTARELRRLRRDA